MALSVDAVSKGTAGVSSSLTWSHTCAGTANKIAVLTATGNGTTGARQILSVTYNGVSLTQKGEADDGAWAHAEIWELNSPATGANNVVVTPDSSGTPIQIAAYAISFIDANTTSGTASTNTGTSTNPSVTVADSASGDIVISVSANDNESGATTEGGTLIGEDEGIDGDLDANAQRQTASGTNTACNWTNSGSGSGWAAVGVSIRAAAASAYKPRGMLMGIG